MKKKIYSLVFCLMAMGQTWAGDVLTVAAVTVPQGSEATLEVGCEFETQFKAFQFDIELPEGLSLVVNVDGKPVCEIGFEGTDHTVSTSTIEAGKYRFVCTSANNLLLPMSGTLLKVKVVGGGSVSVGESFEGKVTNTEFTAMNYDVTNLAEVKFTVTIGEAPDTHVVLDETSTTVPEAATGVDVRVKRTINAGEWSTICLPFAMTAAQVKTAFGDKVQLADFTEYSTTEEGDEVATITINFANATAIEANHPYIIKVSAPVTEFTADDVTINPEANPSVEYDNGLTGKKRKVLGTFAGTYVADFDFYNEAEHYPLFLSGNKFYYATENTKHMKAFRGYFDFVDNLPEAESASSRISMVFSNEAQGISEIANSKSSNRKWYDLQGREVKTHAHGLYIVNGKKVIK